jgi:hypothetical protein
MASYSFGTVSINIGSTALTGSATNWGSAGLTVNWFITFDNSKTWYQIYSIFSNTNLQLWTPYNGTVNISGGSYLAVNQIPEINIADIPTTLPGGPGVLWSNAGILTISS